MGIPTSFKVILWLSLSLNSPDAPSEKDANFAMENSQQIGNILYSMELINKYEKDFLFSNEYMYHINMGLVKETFEFLKDVPKVRDFHPTYCNLWPKGYYISHQLSMIRKHKEYLKERYEWEFDREDVLRIAIKDVERHEDIWWNIYVINGDEEFPRNKREAYKHLKKALGNKFGDEELPPMIPVWTLRK
jgi:hypothetical protein